MTPHFWALKSNWSGHMTSKFFRTEEEAQAYKEKSPSGSYFDVVPCFFQP